MLRSTTDAHISSLGYLWPNRLERFVHAKGWEGKRERLERARGERRLEGEEKKAMGLNSKFLR